MSSICENFCWFLSISGLSSFWVCSLFYLITLFCVSCFCFVYPRVFHAVHFTHAVYSRRSLYSSGRNKAVEDWQVLSRIYHFGGCYDCFKLSDWSKTFNIQSECLKNQCSKNLRSILILGSAPSFLKNGLNQASFLFIFVLF